MASSSSWFLASKLERNNVTVCGDQRGLATPKFVVVAF
jgi:hypothetical protein